MAIEMSGKKYSNDPELMHVQISHVTIIINIMMYLSGILSGEIFSSFLHGPFKKDTESS